MGDPGGLARWETASRPFSARVQSCQDGGGRTQIERSAGSEPRGRSGTQDSLRLVGHGGQHRVTVVHVSRAWALLEQTKHQTEIAVRLAEYGDRCFLQKLCSRELCAFEGEVGIPDC